jgi:hypothetical protein
MESPPGEQYETISFDDVPDLLQSHVDVPGHRTVTFTDPNNAPFEEGRYYVSYAGHTQVYVHDPETGRLVPERSMNDTPRSVRLQRMLAGLENTMTDTEKSLEHCRERWTQLMEEYIAAVEEEAGEADS